MAPTAGDIDIVSRIPIFAALKPAIVQRIIASATIVELEERQALFHQGEAATALFIVLSGWIKLYRVTMAGDETVIHVLTRGSSFAEAVAFTRASYPVTAEAVSRARVIRIPADRLLHCIKDNPEIALAMVASTSQLLHHLVQQVEQLKAQSGVQRVAEFLASLCPIDDGPAMVALPYDKGLIAARLGLKPESLSRAFAKLRAAGVEVSAAHVAIRDVARLHELAAGERAAMSEALRNGGQSLAQ